MRLFPLMLLPCLLSLPTPPLRAQAVSLNKLEDWKVTGKVSVDPERVREGGGAAFLLPPGSKMEISLREEAASGRVSMWIFDSGIKPPEDQIKQRRTGPRWGVAQPDGRVLAGAMMYAPYLIGDQRTVLVESDQKVWFNIKDQSPRQQGWSRWEFVFDPEKGGEVKVNGKALRRFNWNSTQVGGFSGIVLYGDSEGAAPPHPLWVEGIEVELGPPMVVVPVPPPPPPPAVPETDPAPEGEVPALVPELAGKHPRLLFSAEDVPKLREFYNSEAGAPWRKSFDEYVPSSKPFEEPIFLKDATDGQRQGFWRLPTVALHYVLTGSPESFRNTVGFMEKLLALEHWETGGERDSGMSAANIMIGAALAFDWLHNDLEPEFRERFRQKLLLQARRMYHGGHLNGNKIKNAYWQGDPQNNHRWHRNAGMTLCLLTAYTGAPEEQWLLQRTQEELAYIMRWLPEDGTSHEGPSYLAFGGNHLMLAMHASDRCLGTDHLQSPFFKTVGEFTTGLTRSGFSAAFGFGDWGGNGFGIYNNFLLKTAAVNRDADLRDALLRIFEQQPKFFSYTWFSLIWDDPTLARGDANRRPLHMIWPDVGVTVMRDSWEKEGVAAMFKCGPFGGYLLNKFSQEHGNRYVNVAHDDPDANSFLLAIGGDLLAETDRYSKTKQSAGHNTILINGKGQMTKGREEGTVWSQPGGDMTKMGILTAWRPTPGVAAVEGEAAGSYLAYNNRKSGVSRPALDRFRRTFLWVDGAYALVLDDIRAPEAVDIDWLMQGPDLRELNPAEGRFELVAGDKTTPFQVVADQQLTFNTRVSPADHRGTPLGFRQLVASARAEQLFVASVYNPWGVKGLTVRLEKQNAGEAVIVVESETFRDVWSWRAGGADLTPSRLSAKRERGPEMEGFPFELTPENSKVPH